MAEINVDTPACSADSSAELISPTGRRRNVPSWLAAVLKVLVAVVLISWMVTTGRLNPRNLAAALRRWDLLAQVAALFYGQILLTAFRWHLLLRSQNIRLSFRDTLSLNMVGTLFNTVIPGAVGGDVMKGYYLSRREMNRRTQAFTTLLLDRVLGLLGLLVLPLIAAAWNYDLIARSAAMQALLMMLIGIVTAGVLALIAALTFGSSLLALVDSKCDRFPALRKIHDVLVAVMQYQNHSQLLGVSICLSVFNHVMGAYGFLLCVRAIYPADLHTGQFLFIVPLGLLTTAIPVSPAGIGVGQAAFFTLFGLLPGLTGRLGSEACTLYQCVMVAVYLTGFFVYIFHPDLAGERTASASDAARLDQIPTAK